MIAFIRTLFPAPLRPMTPWNLFLTRRRLMFFSTSTLDSDTSMLLQVTASTIRGSPVPSCELTSRLSPLSLVMTHATFNQSYSPIRVQSLLERRWAHLRPAFDTTFRRTRHQA